MAEGRKPTELKFLATEGPHNFPKRLNALMPLVLHIINQGPDWKKSYQALITILSLARLSKELPDLDLEAIVSPRMCTEKSFNRFFKGFKEFTKNFKPLRTKKPVDLSGGLKPRMRLTQGPNRQVTLASSIKEAKLLLNDNVLGKSFRNFCVHTNCQNFLAYVEGLSEMDTDVSDAYLGRLALVPDSLNKHRLVAMVDYWTNLLLAPLEELVRSLLVKFFHKTDFLRNHEEGSTRVRDYNGPSWSVDLSS